MSTHDHNDEHLHGVIRTLQALRPTAPGIDRDHLLYDAGRRSARGQRGWQAATVLACLGAAVLGFAWYRSPTDVRETIVYVPVVERPSLVANESPDAPYEMENYQTLRAAVLRTGAITPPALDLDIPQRPVLTAGSYALQDFHRGRNHE